MAEADLSKIVSLIMENPALIEQIRELAKNDGGETVTMSTEKADEEKPTESAPVMKEENPSRLRRRELLSALKPYLSESRAGAIDSMMSISDILEVMKTR